MHPIELSASDIYRIAVLTSTHQYVHRGKELV